MSRRFPPAKWTLPDVVNPPDSVCYVIHVPKNTYHIGAFLGALYNLTSARFWQDDPGHTALDVAKVWQDIFDGLVATDCAGKPVPIFGLGDEGDDMSALAEPYCRDDGSCGYHFRCDICGSWHDVATADDLLKATTSPGPTTTQPQPGGGTVQNCLKMYANALLPIPLFVNTGDTILINSASGSWWDGGEFDFGPLWREPNGNQFVGGLDVGFPKSGVSGDAVTAANHMSIVAVIGATPDYVALPIGTPVTVPSVGPNSQLFFMVNDDPTGIANNQGDCQVCYTITNNQAATFSHTFNFTTGSQGFIPTFATGVDRAAWAAGLGWGIGPSVNSGVVQIQSPTVASRVYTKCEVFISTPLTHAQQQVDFVYPDISGTNVVVAMPTPIVDQVIPLASVSTPSFCINLEDDLTTTGTPVYGGYITKVIVTGIGTDPF